MPTRDPPTFDFQAASFAPSTHFTTGDHNFTHDDTDKLKNSGLVLTFEAVTGGTGKIETLPKVSFKAFITKFKDDHQLKFDVEERHSGIGNLVYRAGQSARMLNVSFDVPARSTVEAVENLKNVTSLVQMMFPVEGDAGQRNPKKLYWKINYMNLISDFTGIVENFSVTPDLDVGAFVVNNVLFPKLFKIDFSCKYQPMASPVFRLKRQGNSTIFHMGDVAKPNYPYGVSGLGVGGTTTSRQDAPTSPPDEEKAGTSDAEERDDVGDGTEDDSSIPPAKTPRARPPACNPAGSGEPEGCI